MPPFKAIPSLYSSSLDVIAQTLLSNDGVKGHYSVPQSSSSPWFDSPPGMKLSDVISERMLSKCSLEDIPLCRLFTKCVPTNIIRLDLTGFVRFGPVDSDTFHAFDEALGKLLTKIPLVRELILKTHEKFTYIPKVRNHHLNLIGSHCPLLEDLDISYNKLVTGEGLRCLLHCGELRRLYIFKVTASESDVLALLASLPHLIHLGYKSLGNVVHNLGKKRRKRLKGSYRPQLLRLTHLDNTGTYGHQSGGLRCKPFLFKSIQEACPEVKTLKLRVKDEDVSAFELSRSVRNVELVFNVGVPSSPSQGTIKFMAQCGGTLSSVALVCSSMSPAVVIEIAAGCPLLESLWIRCNVFNDTPPPFSPLSRKRHPYLKRLRVLYIRIGENEREIFSLPADLLHFLLRNAGSTLRELSLFALSPLLTDAYVFQTFVELHLKELRKVLFLLPGEMNSCESRLPLTLQTVSFLLHFCPEIVRIGNVACWSVDRGELWADETLRGFLDGNYNLNILDKRI